MQGREWPAIIGAAMFALLAVGSAIFMLASSEIHAPVIAGAVLLLAAGQAVALFVQWTRDTGLDERVSEQERRLHSSSGKIVAMAERMVQMQQQIAHFIGGPLNEIVEELRSLRDQVNTLSQDAASNRAPASEIHDDTTPEQPEPAARKQSAPAQERLDLLLEPVVELATGATAHYRARVNMVSQSGGEVLHEEMMRQADAGGMRAALDVHVARLAFPVLRRLRNKHPAMCLLLPLGAATLKTEQDISRLLQVMDDMETARGIVFDIAQGDLAGLDGSGIAGLARLGRLGVRMALSKVSVTGLDLASLRQLGVRFLDIDAKGLSARAESAPAWIEFAQFARAMQFQMIGGGIESASQADNASRVARFGYGPYFAPPRRVRADAGRAAHADRIQAA